MMKCERETRKGRTALAPELLSEFEGALRRRKSLLEGDVLGLERDWTDQSELDPAHSSHMAESGSDAFEEDVRLARMESAGDEICEIEEALGRIRDGAYGICEGCRAPVPVARLRAIPYTRLCIPCKETEETA
jgi:RNA polymerase-binding transcription factor DksA